MIFGNRVAKTKLVEQLTLVTLQTSHHGSTSPRFASTQRNHGSQPVSTDFCNKICQLPTFWEPHSKSTNRVRDSHHRLRSRVRRGTVASRSAEFRSSDNLVAIGERDFLLSLRQGNLNQH